MTDYIENFQFSDGQIKTIGGEPFNGTWTQKVVTLINNASIAKDAYITVDLNPYLPDDNHDYEITFMVVAVTGATSGNSMEIQCRAGSSVESTPVVRSCYAITRTGSNEHNTKSSYLYIKASDRFITCQNKGNANATGFSLYLKGYRRIGTNGLSDKYISHINIDGVNSTIGGWNYDGGWTPVSVQIASGVSIGASGHTDYSLASILPNDNYNYLVLVTGWGDTGATSGNSSRMKIINGKYADVAAGKATDFYMFGGVTRTGSTRALGGSVLVPVFANNRYICINNTGGATATVTCHIRGYKRFGQNADECADRYLTTLEVESSNPNLEIDNYYNNTIPSYGVVKQRIQYDKVDLDKTPNPISLAGSHNFSVDFGTERYDWWTYSNGGAWLGASLGSGFEGAVTYQGRPCGWSSGGDAYRQNNNITQTYKFPTPLPPGDYRLKCASNGYNYTVELLIDGVAQAIALPPSLSKTEWKYTNPISVSGNVTGIRASVQSYAEGWRGIGAVHLIQDGAWTNEESQIVKLSDYSLDLLSGTPETNDVLDLTYTTINDTLGKSATYMSYINLGKNRLPFGGPQFDGQWVYCNAQLASLSSMASGTDYSVNLSSILPNDGYAYEILIDADINTQTTQAAEVYVRAGLNENAMLVRCIARSSTQRDTASIIIPVDTNRILYLRNAIGATTGACNVYIRAYRRLGTNV